jgi:hypothetical protein
VNRDDPERGCPRPVGAENHPGDPEPGNLPRFKSPQINSSPDTREDLGHQRKLFERRDAADIDFAGAPVSGGINLALKALSRVRRRADLAESSTPPSSSSTSMTGTTT